MKKAFVGSLITVGLLAPLPAPATGLPQKAPEACLAVNPGQPTCTLTISADPGATAQGWEGVGTWTISVKRGKKTYRFKSDGSAAPGPVQVWGHTFSFKVGDVLTATAVSPGSAILAGHTS